MEEDEEDTEAVTGLFGVLPGPDDVELEEGDEDVYTSSVQVVEVDVTVVDELELEAVTGELGVVYVTGAVEEEVLLEAVTGEFGVEELPGIVIVVVYVTGAGEEEVLLEAVTGEFGVVELPGSVIVVVTGIVSVVMISVVELDGVGKPEDGVEGV